MAVHPQTLNPHPAVSTGGNPGFEDDLLRVELEDLGGKWWWTSLLTTLTGQSGTTYQRFVAVRGRERCYTSATFPVPRTLGPLPPDEQWAPGLKAALAQLTARITADGWTLVGRGPQLWDLTYRQGG